MAVAVVVGRINSSNLGQGCVRRSWSQHGTEEKEKGKEGDLVACKY
jgi:hypothetical protein